jgi:hypothetical protein
MSSKNTYKFAVATIQTRDHFICFITGHFINGHLIKFYLLQLTLAKITLEFALGI